MPNTDGDHDQITEFCHLSIFCQSEYSDTHLSQSTGEHGGGVSPKKSKQGEGALLVGMLPTGRASDHHVASAGSIPRCSDGFFSKSQLSVQTLLRVSVHPCVQSHALTPVHTLKIL